MKMYLRVVFMSPWTEAVQMLSLLEKEAVTCGAELHAGANELSMFSWSLVFCTNLSDQEGELSK